MPSHSYYSNSRSRSYHQHYRSPVSRSRSSGSYRGQSPHDRRSRSPRYRDDYEKEYDDGRRSPRSHGHKEYSEQRSRSHHHPHHHHRHHHGRSRRRSHSRPEPQQLPFDAPKLSKGSMGDWKPLFALYLDIQKGLDIDEISEREGRGRWKRFVEKWNRGDLPEGWYDPTMKQKALSSVLDEASKRNTPQDSPPPESSAVGAANHNAADEMDAEFGPAPPLTTRKNIHGPSIPSTQDLQLRREGEIDEHEAAQEELRAERKADRRLQQERLEELDPRAEPGTRERQIEKRREVAAANRSFAQSREAGDVDVKDEYLMGPGDDGDDLKRMKQQQEKKKNERDIRREEALRARAKEREERKKEFMEKEEKTMGMLKQLAKERFG